MASPSRLNGDGAEFGEHNLVEALRRHRESSPEALVASIVDEVQRFGPHEQP